MKKNKKKWLALALMIFMLLPINFASGVSTKELVSDLPYSNAIIYTKDGDVDAAYYETMQKKIIAELDKKHPKKLSLMRSSASHNTLPGDVYVSFSGTSSGVDFALVGHASIVETSGGLWCISSWPKNGSPNGLDGVQYEHNYWPGKSNIYALRVKNADENKRQNAVSLARGYVNKSPRLPYNWFFLNKFTTSSFYCSQLVWRCWNDTGFNIDRMPYDTVVSPAELVSDKVDVLFRN